MTQTNKPFCELYHKTGGETPVNGIYRIRLGRRQNQNVWIIDGFKIAQHVYPAFVMGGNDQRYRFNPDNDVWIDNRIGCEELEYTIAHELLERKLMREEGMTYDRAHDLALDLEKRMRAGNEVKVARHVQKADPAIKGVYRQFVRKIGNLSVWIVDGPLVRKELNGDFCFASHDLEYSFIPENEVWLDSAMSCEQMHYALAMQLEERRLMDSGLDQESAYEGSLIVAIAEQGRQEKLSRKREKHLSSITFGVRERGVKQRRRSRKKT